jgi:trk system potassium uptake protein TrkH
VYSLFHYEQKPCDAPQRTAKNNKGRTVKPFEKSDSFYLLLFFFIVISAGALLLYIPGMWRKPDGTPAPVAFTDACFIATSAVCNAGLSTLDLAGLSPAGRILVIFLMQTGGIGIISFSCLLAIIPGNRLALSRRNTIQGFYLDGIEYRPRKIIRNIIIFTAAIEVLGITALAVQFALAGVEEPLFMGVFHGISAFCNTGLSLFPDQMRSFSNNTPVLLTVMLLILLGGIGFIVLHDSARTIGGILRGKKARLSYHSRVVLGMTGGIILAGTVFFFVMEHTRLYRSIHLTAEWMNALFQTINPRSGGFDVLPQDRLSQPSKVLTCLLMLSGGAPGSIAGGIKLTTLFVVFAVMLRKPDRDGDIVVFRRRLPRTAVHNAVVYTLKALGLLMVFIGALAVIEGLRGMPVGRIVFEVFSAFGTVGLSLGLTGELSVPGRWVIIAAMFAGRVGLIALAFPVVRRGSLGVNYPEGSLLLG